MQKQACWYLLMKFQVPATSFTEVMLNKGEKCIPWWCY